MRPTIEEIPDFNADDRRWLTVQSLESFIGLKEAQLRNVRRAWGNPFEHPDSGRIWIYGPAWLRKWYAERSGGAADRIRIAADTPDETSHRDRKEKAQADKAEIEVQRLRSELVPVDDLRRHYGTVAAKLKEGLEVIGRLSPESQQVMIGKLQEATEAFRQHYGDPSSPAQRNGKADCV